MKFRSILISLILGIISAGHAALAQAPTTTITDTVYRADGTPASGTLVISWNAFTTASGAAVPAGNTTVTLATGGALTVALAPNAGANPMGSYYTVVYHLNDGTTSREYWVVPIIASGGTPAKLATIRNQVLPTSVAMQTVSKQYVDTAIAEAAAGFPVGSTPFVLKTGDTMTGPLVLPSDPVSAYQAADKNYVDASVAASETGTISVSRLPLFGPSGSAHAAGIVPDPGASAGSTHFLREDGTWSLPAGATSYWSLNTGTNDIYSTNSSREVGVGTTTPGQWSAINVTGNGTNVQIADAATARLIVAGNYGEFHFVSTGAPSGEKNWRLFADPSGHFTLAMNADDYSTSTIAYQCLYTGACTFSNGLAASAFHETLSTPASSSSACSAGDFTDDANFHYVCVATNTWKRTALSSF